MKQIEDMTTEELKKQLVISDKVIRRLQGRIGKNEGYIARLETTNEGLMSVNKELSESLSKIKQLEKDNKNAK